MISVQAWIIALIIASSTCAPRDEQVTGNVHIDYQHKWYSGYLNFSKSSFHYVFFDSQRDPANDPLILWLNGGPGCSSLIGMVTENGPFVFKTNTTTLKLNPYAWNLKANLLYIESPGGVGFSKGERRIYDDGNTAEDNLEALLAFFQKFPELRKNDFYISGESYAGIYIPYLSNKIIQFNKKASSKNRIIKLKGIMIGNACTHPKQCYDATAQGNSMYQYQFLYQHTFYTDSKYTQFLSKCALNFTTEPCISMRKQMDSLFYKTNTSILNIYSPCYYNMANDDNNYNKKEGGKNRGKYRKIHKSKFVGLEDSDMDCEDSLGIDYYFNIPLMYRHLHVDYVHFQQCSDYVANTYVSFANGSYWIYPLLMKEGLRIWIYSGDVDADVPITGTLTWLQLLKKEQGLPVVTPWREWWTKGLHKHEDQVGGMVWELKGISFVSIKGAGHLVPKDKPIQAYALISNFIEGTSMPQKQE